MAVVTLRYMSPRRLPVTRFRLDAESPPAELELVVAHWRSTSLISDPTISRFVEILESFTARLVMAGHNSVLAASEDDCSNYIRSATKRGVNPSVPTLHLRRTAIRALFRSVRQLGVDCADPTTNLELPARQTRTTRPLDDHEVALLRVVATDTNAALIAACGAGATTNEATRLTPCDLRGTTLHLPGATRIRARTAQLDEWAASTLRTAASQATTNPAGDQTLIRLGEAKPGTQRAQAAACNRLRRLMTTCGITGDNIRPQSLRLHAATATLAATSQIEAAARTLGHTSLDATADAIQYQWSNQ